MTERRNATTPAPSRQNAFPFFDSWRTQASGGRVGLYAYASMSAACLWSLWQMLEGAGMESLVLPVVCAACLAFRSRVLSVLLLVVLFGLAVIMGYWSLSEPSTHLLFCMLGISVFMCVLRFQTVFPYSKLAEDATGILVGQHLSSSSGNEMPSAIKHVTFGHEILALAIGAVCCSLVSYVWLELIESKIHLAGEFGFQSYGLRAIALTLSVFVFLIMVQALLGYVRWRRMSRMESLMHLQHEFWLWSAGEQKIMQRHRARLDALESDQVD